MPVAVRQSLNRAAFDVKKNTMPKEAKVFTQRAPTFFRATSRVKPAEGFVLANMEATVGFMKGNANKEKGRATENLEQQEKSGVIDKRAFIPLAKARAGKSYKRRVMAKHTLTAIKNEGMFDSASKRLNKAKNWKEKFILSAIYAKKGGYVIGNTRSKGQRKLMYINSVKRVGKNTAVNSTAIYSVKSKRKVSVKKTNFMRTASMESASKIEKYYIEEANKQIAKYKGK